MRVPDPPSSRRHWNILGRMLRIVWMVLWHIDPAVIGHRVAEDCDDLGGLWIKVAQILSLRFDQFPAEFCRELAHLTHHAYGFSESHAGAIVSQQLDRPVRDIFDQFDDRGPVAAASMGQVHRWHLRREQRWVAVKVRAPYAAESFAADLAMLGTIARFTSWMVPRYRFVKGVEELRRIVAEELDFRFEANGMRRMRKTLKPHDIYTPILYTQYSTEQVLVAEWIDGVMMADWLKVYEEDPTIAMQWAIENGIKITKLSRWLIDSFCRQLFEDNRVHGDLHPGNIMLLRNGWMALLDYGTTFFTERDFLTKYRDFVKALAERRYVDAADWCCQLSARLPRRTLLEIIHLAPSAKLIRLKAALLQVMQDWAVRTEIASLDYYEKSLTAITTAIMQTVLSFGGYMRWAWLRIMRALTTLDTTLATLNPFVNYAKATRRYFRQASDRQRLVAPLHTALHLLDRVADLDSLTAHLVEYARLRVGQSRVNAFPAEG